MANAKKSTKKAKGMKLEGHEGRLIIDWGAGKHRNNVTFVSKDGAVGVKLPMRATQVEVGAGRDLSVVVNLVAELPFGMVEYKGGRR